MDNNTTYKQGDIIRPTEAHTGYAQVFKVEAIPKHRYGMYCGEEYLYHVYTDFGNVMTLLGSEITSSYEVAGNECVSERVARWKESVMSAVDMIEKQGKVRFNNYSFYLEDFDQTMLDYIEANLEFWEVGCMLFSTDFKYLKYDRNSDEFYTADYKTDRDELWSKDMFWEKIYEQQETL